MNLSRRKLFLGAATLLVAPSIVRADSLMGVKPAAAMPSGITLNGIPIVWDEPPQQNRVYAVCIEVGPSGALVYRASRQ